MIKKKVTALKRYMVMFDLNVIDFCCITRAENKKKAIEDVVWNLNLRTLKKINGIKAIQIGEAVTTTSNATSPYRRVEALVRQQIAKELIDCLPTTWLDPMLTGKDAVLGKNPWGCPDIEKLINAIRKKMKVVGNLPA
jgi:hypothetical protein